MKQTQALADGSYLLERFQAKGGWTYARIPGVQPDKTNPFGWYRVRGSIDGFEIKSYHLMPLGNGELFLPVKAEIRKKIRKKEGDHVQVILFTDTEPVEIPEELLICLQDEEKAYHNFMRFSEAEKKYYIDWIYSAKREETKISRITTAIKKLSQGKKMTDK